MSTIVFFLLSSILPQIAYFFFLRRNGAWLGWTIATEGMIFALAFGFVEIFFWIGWIVLVIGMLLVFYVLLEKKFLPKWMNKIIYHPKLNKLIIIK